MPDQHPRPDRTDEDALRIAKQIVWEARQRPDPDNRGALSAAMGSQSETDPDEDRIERALIDMGAVSPRPERRRHAREPRARQVAGVGRAAGVTGPA
jgi:hypothetical protein